MHVAQRFGGKAGGAEMDWTEGQWILRMLSLDVAGRRTRGRAKRLLRDVVKDEM